MNIVNWGDYNEYRNTNVCNNVLQLMDFWGDHLMCQVRIQQQHITHTEQVKILLTEDKENRANTSMKRRKCVRCTYKITSLNMWCIWIGMLWNGLDWIELESDEVSQVVFILCTVSTVHSLPFDKSTKVLRERIA